MRLYEIADKIERILAQEVCHETGEITDETIAALDALEMARDGKLLALAAYEKGETAEAEAVNYEVEKLKKRMAGHVKRAERLLDYMRQNFPQDAPKLSDARSVIQWRKNPPRVELEDWFLKEGSDCSPLWRHIPPSDEPDKKEIARALKRGETIEGAKLVYSMRLDVK